jgi:thiamine pyrophosphate-dependent acetolactate synthase large subunit-like protein
MTSTEAGTGELAYQLIAGSLRERGIETFFGLMGEDTAALTVELSRAGARYVPARHEAGVVGMADGYGWARREVALALVTRGPGLTNALTAARIAVRAGRRLLIVTGDSPTTRWYLPDPKHVDQRAVAEAAGLAFFGTSDPDRVGEAFEAAWASADAGTPAVLAVAANVLNGPVPPTGVALQPIPPPAAAASDGGIEGIVELLRGCARPLVLAGRGAMTGETPALLVAVAEKIGALLGTTLPARDLFRGHPYHLGVVGGFATEAAEPLLREVDCVLAFGASLSDFTTSQRTLFTEAKVVHVDVDPAQIGACHDVDIAVVGDARSVAEALRDSLSDATPGRGFHTAATRRQLASPLYGGHDESIPGHVDPRLVATILDDALPEHRTIVCDTGRFSTAPSRYMRSSGVDTFRLVAEFGAVGGALAPALGAALARPDATTILFTGDGGIMLGIAELETAARLEIPLLVVVMNDHAFGAEKAVLEAAGLPSRYAEFPETDLAAIARGMGIEAVTVRSPGDLREILPRLAERSTPILLDCKIRPDLVVPRVTGR